MSAVSSVGFQEAPANFCRRNIQRALADVQIGSPRAETPDTRVAIPSGMGNAIGPGHALILRHLLSN